MSRDKAAMKRVCDALSAVLVLAFSLTGCSEQPTVPSSAAPVLLAPLPAPPPALPVAVLAIRSDVSPALGVSQFTPMMFDASGSTGTGLTYRIEFGDGESSPDVLATHVGMSGARKHTARLTVSDGLGRSDAVTQDYFLASIHESGTWWYHMDDRRQSRVLYLFQEGATLRGWYSGPENPYPEQDWPLTGMLSGQRTMYLRVDGGIEFTGSVEWLPLLPVNMSQARVVLRLSQRGGFADNKTLDFRWADPY